MSSLSHLEAWPVETVSAALIKGDCVVESLGDTSRQFPVASVTKLVSAYAVLLAVEEGAVELIRQRVLRDRRFDTCSPMLRGGLDSRQLQRPVGQRRIYSSAGYEWAAQVVEEATGMAFSDYLSEGCASRWE